MQPSTEQIIMIALNADNTIAQETTAQVIAILKGKINPDAPDGDRVITRAEVAAMIGHSKTLVDIYGRKGIFKKVRFKGAGKRQAQGYSFKSVQAAIRDGMAYARQ